MRSHHFQFRFLLDEETLHLFSVLGRALYTAQHLELNCRLLVKHTLTMQNRKEISGDIGDKPFLEQAEQLWKKPLGCQIDFLKKYFFEFNNNPDNYQNSVSTLLCEAKNARNEIAHVSSLDFEDYDDFDVDPYIDKLRPLIRKIAEADKYIAMLLHVLNQKKLPSLTFTHQYEDLVEQWVTAPTFND